MRDEQMRELLRASETKRTTPDTSALLHGVRERVRQRARRQTWQGAVAAVLLAGLFSVTQLPTRTPAPEPTPTVAVASQRDFAAEADMRAALAERMAVRATQRERIAALQAELDRPLAPVIDLAAVHSEVDRAAATLFRTGERLRADRLQRSACKRYRNVIDLYPDSSWARLAQARLASCTDF